MVAFERNLKQICAFLRPIARVTLIFMEKRYNPAFTFIRLLIFWLIDYYSPVIPFLSLYHWFLEHL